MSKKRQGVRSPRDERRERRRNARPSRVSRTRLLIFGGITAVVIGLAGYFLWPVFRPVGPGTPGAVAVQVSMGGFSPPRLTAKVGEPLTLRLVNRDNQFHTDGGGWHQFAIDALGVDQKIAPTTSPEFTFTPSRAGQFLFYCDVCCGGKENPSMQGSLVVEI